MTTEQKAKRYEEAIEAAKKELDTCGSQNCDAARQIFRLFPELKESEWNEDERIRKGLIGYFRAGKCENISSYHGISTNDILAWLEKQGQVKESIISQHENKTCKESDDSLTSDDIRKGLIQYFSTFTLDTFAGLDPKKILSWLVKQGEQKSIWHNEDEEPQRGSLILLIMQSGKPIVAKIIEPNHTFNHGERWAYIDDLLEKQGEQKKELLQKLDEKLNNALENETPESLKKFLVEQKSVDKVEPKFREGEWLCENELNNYARFVQILEIVNVQGKDRYKISRDIHKDEDIVEFDFVEKYYHKFDIKDAKDGDILITNKKQPFIFNGHYDEDTGYIYAYCGISDLVKDDSFYTEEECVDEEFAIWCTSENVCPATKEQRDILMKAIADAGYTFDFEKKELKKIEQNLVTIDIDKMVSDYANNKEHSNEEFGKPVNCMIRAYRQGLNDVIRKVGQKPARSEEDSVRLQRIIDFLWKNRKGDTDTIYQQEQDVDWLKNLKDRCISQPKQEWSEEDKRKIDRIYSILMEAADTHAFSTSCRLIGDKECVELQDFLKSLRPQKQWKPSDEQMEALHDAAVYVDKSMFPYPKGILMKLYEQLKKLKS